MTELPTRHATLPIASARPVLLALSALLLAACGGGMPEMPPPQVGVASVLASDQIPWEEFSGRIEASAKAEIRPRVAGILTGVHFREGGLVRRGALLFTLDDREYRAALASASADLVRAEARERLARSELARSESLIEARAVSAGELETRRNEAQQAEADVQAARARLDRAELDLEFTRITAPITGRIGEARLREGNLVGIGEPLASVVAEDPVYVRFRSDEQGYLRQRASIRETGPDGSASPALAVRVGLANEADFPHSARLDFVDNVLDPATGTLLVRAELANPHGHFTPGLFARVRLQTGPARSNLLVHPQAVLTDQDRRFVFVVVESEDGRRLAQRRDIVPGPTIDGLVVVESGLEAGDRVVVQGMGRIFAAGTPVLAHEVAMATLAAVDASAGVD